VKKWETSVGPRCLSNGSTSSPRTKMEHSRRERAALTIASPREEKLREKLKLRTTLRKVQHVSATL